MFESPYILIGAAAAAFCVVTLYRNAVPQKARWWQWLIPVFIFVAAFAVDFIVVTDREKIVSVVKTARDAVLTQDYNIAIDMIDESYYDSRGLNKQAIAGKVQKYLGRPLAEKIKINSNVITIEDSKATSKLNVTVHLDQNSSYAQYVTLAIIQAKVDFVQRDNDWYVSGFEIEKVNNSEPPRW